VTPDDLIPVLIALIFVLIAMYFVAIEQALIRVSRAAVNDMVDDGVRGAPRLALVLEDRGRYINVLLIARLIAEMFSVVVVTAICIRQFTNPPWLGLVIAGIVMSIVAFVALGVGPRTIGQQHATAVALRGARVARILAVILNPIAVLLVLLGNALTPGKGYRQGPFANSAELREMVDLAQADDVIEADERQMIHGVFELGDTLAREVMVPRTEMVWIEKDKLLRQAMSLALRSGFSRIPVVGENLDDVIGAVYLKDLARHAFDDQDAQYNQAVETLMRPVSYVPDSKPADDLLREMQADRVHLSVVVDEYGGTAGLVTIEDIVEEIVGEIADEYDTAELPESQELGPGSWRVSSRMQLDDLVELPGLQLTESDLSEDMDEVETVAGLLARRLGVVPIPGSSVEVGSYQLRAESTAGRRNRIGAVLITTISPPAQSSEEKHD